VGDHHLGAFSRPCWKTRNHRLVGKGSDQLDLLGGVSSTSLVAQIPFWNLFICAKDLLVEANGPNRRSWRPAPLRALRAGGGPEAATRASRCACALPPG